MELTKTWHELYGLRYCPLNIVQPLFAAGTIYLLSGIQAASGVRIAKKELKHSFDSLKLCIQHLREIGKSWRCASTVESILRGLIEERLKPVVEKRKAAAPKPHHGRSTSEGDGSIYLANPPSSSRRPTSLRRSRVHQTGNSSSICGSRDDMGVVTSPLHSPTISVHPAMDDFSHHVRQHGGFGSQPGSASQSNQELLSPWSAHGSPTQPIPIRGGGSSSNGSSSSGSPVSVRMSASPGRQNASMVSSSPTTPELQHASPSGSFNAGSSMPQSFANQDNSDPFFGLFNNSSFDQHHTSAGASISGGGQDNHQPHQADFSAIEMSRYFAMLGGQPLSAMPFVGPIPNNNSESAVGIFDQQWQMQQQQQHQGRPTGNSMDLSDLDFSQFQTGAPEHLTGEATTNGVVSADILGGYYPPFGGGLPSTTGDFSFAHRRAASENFRTGAASNGHNATQTNAMELFQSDFDFTADYQ
ncbi:hypothetical protein BKA70DRAFT_603941 [Coprinopsis sp. MPI-PUGE-AT-0042]|nr:hypothetical protein BKA70DRAFT_603941 [Coprinopsis sp. MPI-PUGE-AT-0042]